MAVVQLAVFLENRVGSLGNVLALLAQNGINIRALSLADKAHYGILRLIVNDTGKALGILKAGNFSVNETPVLAIEVDDRPGGLAAVLGVFAEHSLNIEYMYAFVEKSHDKAIVVFRTENVQEAERVLKDRNIRLLGEPDIRSI